jgi:hypothetical protein
MAALAGGGSSAFVVPFSTVVVTGVGSDVGSCGGERSPAKSIDHGDVVFIVAVCTGRRLSVRPSWYGSEIDLALEGWPRWSGFSLKILDVPPSARVLSQPTRPIPKRRADVTASFTGRGEHISVKDS